MKTALFASICTSLLLLSCAAGKFQAYEGSLSEDQICSLSIFPPEEGSVQISSINGVEVNGSEALLKGGTENQIALTFKNKNGALTQTVTLNAPAGASCKASATTEERNFKMGSAETRTFAALWIECQGAIAAGSDHSDDMEQVQ